MMVFYVYIQRLMRFRIHSFNKYRAHTKFYVITLQVKENFYDFCAIFSTVSALFLWHFMQFTKVYSMLYFCKLLVNF